MSDDPLVREWTASGEVTGDQIRAAVHAALAQDRIAHDRGRLVRRFSIGCAALLWVALLWCAAHAVTPLVRGGYALMAAGVAVMLFAEFAYASWSLQARPGTRDSLTQIRTTILMLARQASLMRAAPAWCAPIFVGAGLIGRWIYAERSHTGAAVFWAVIAAGWLLILWGGRHRGRELDERRKRMEQVLSDLNT